MYTAAAGFLQQHGGYPEGRAALSELGEKCAEEYCSKPMARQLEGGYSAVKAVVIQILIAIDHPILRNSLRNVLEHDPEFRVVGEASTGREALLLAEYKRPHAVVMDFALSGTGGLAVARRISANYLEILIFFVATVDDAIYVCEAHKSGAAGCVSMSDAPTLLNRAIRDAVKASPSRNIGQ